MTKIIFFLFTFLTVAGLRATGASLDDVAKKEVASDPEVVKDDIDKMKQEVINKKSQMLLFKQLIKAEGIESTYPVVNIVHTNEMSSRYKIHSIVYTLDGERVYSYFLEDNLGKPGLSRETQVFKGPLIAGTHELVIDVVYQGNDSGIFNYINDYKIPTQGKKTFKVEKGQNLEVDVVAFEKGWALTEFKDRPDLKIKFNSPQTAKALK